MMTLVQQIDFSHTYFTVARHLKVNVTKDWILSIFDGNSVGMNPPTLHIFQSVMLILMIHLLFIAADSLPHILDHCGG